MTAKINLQKQAEEIIRIAQEGGVQSNFLFVTTFKRYQVQLNILAELENAMKDDDMPIFKNPIFSPPFFFCHSFDRIEYVKFIF